MDKLLQESGVQYSFSPDGGALKEFRYGRKHLQSGKQTIESVYCFNERDFETLLKHWNRGDRWRYWRDTP